MAAKPRLLDLFSGAGGSAVGYHRAGFEVVGVDIKPQPRYPFSFVLADALDVLSSGTHFRGDPIAELFDAIHASPPCQAYVGLSRGNHPRLIEPVRELLRSTGLPYVIENVVGAPLENPVQLCGSSFGLGVRRHRRFECSFPLLVPPCCEHGEIRAYYGNRGGEAWKPSRAQLNAGSSPTMRGSVSEAPADMGIDWMTWDELREAIPPRYTEFIGTQLMAHLKATVAA